MPTFPTGSRPVGPTSGPTQARHIGSGDIPRDDEEQQRQLHEARYARAPSPRNYVGTALVRAGGTLRSAGDRLAVQERREREEHDRFAANAGLIEFEHNARRTVAERSTTAEGEDALEFEATTIEGFDARAREYFKTVPDSQKEAVDLKLRQLRSALSDKAFIHERTKTREHYGEAVVDSQNSLALAVRDDPSLLKGSFDQLKDLIDSLPGAFSDKERDELRTAAQNLLVEEAAKGLAAQGREKEARQLLRDFYKAATRRNTAVDDEGGGIVDRIIDNESGGNRYAKNPASSASGPGQFINSTWIAMMRQYHPDLVRGRSTAEILALRADPVLAREMTARYAEQNTGYLKQHGFEPTPGNIYLAHFLGPHGAVKVLSQDDDTPLASVLDAGTMQANPQLKGRSVGWLRNQMAVRMGTSAVVNNVQIGPEWRDRVDKEINDILKSRATTISRETHDQLEQQILLDPNSVSLDMILGAGLTTAHENGLITKLQTARKKNEDLNAGRIRLESGDDVSDLFNERNKDDRDIVDALVNDPNTLPDFELGSAKRHVELTRRTGVAPRNAVQFALSGIHSTDEDEFVGALEFASQLHAASNRAFDGVTGAKTLKDFVADYGDLIRDGVSPRDAAKAVFNANSDEAPQNIQNLRTAATTYLEEQGLDAEGVITKVYDGVVNPELAQDTMLASGMLNDYKQHWQRHFIDTNGNIKLADLRTLRDMRKMYGTSELAGTSLFGMQGDFVKFPFENYYPPIGDEGHQPYAKDAATRLTEMLGREITPDDVKIIADPLVTGRDIASGGPDAKPRYRVYYRTDVEGQEIWNTAPGAAFYQPDVGTLKEAWRKPREAERLRERRLKTAEDGITLGIDEKGNEVLVDILSREIVEDIDGKIVPTGKQYVPPAEIRGRDPRRSTRVDVGTDIVQPTPRGRPGRIVRPNDFENLRGQWESMQEEIEKRRRTEREWEKIQQPGLEGP